ncbi:MAG: phosphoadenosine phosphosulfate reductase family protein [Candidatus Nanohaloarchaea archaeon]|nr:phosphoadenosine phosphosulfate reductase family protein [Candidatus Nanohaloarchaea archaeon]
MRFTSSEKIIEKYEEFLEKIIRNPSDPRGYHGEHSEEWRCPECGEVAELNEREKRIECSECGENSKLAPIQRQNLSPEDWGVAESCGALKVEPLKDFVEEHGFEKMITGIRGSDMIADGEEHEIELVEEKKDPARYIRVNPLKNWSEENVWAYIKAETVSYPSLYDQGYRHTDSKCCTSDSQMEASEYGEGGIDAEKQAAKNELQDMGYI